VPNLLYPLSTLFTLSLNPQAKLAKLRRELLEPSGGSGGGAAKGDGFDVNKVGDARVGLVGKSA
jgi:ribosome-interacting GTPase 1